MKHERKDGADAVGPRRPTRLRLHAAVDARPIRPPRHDLAAARDVVQAFADRTRPSPWHADRAAVAARLAKLIARPDLLQQRRLNLCGPAAFLRAWAIRDPAAFARFATALYDDGAASIGPLVVRPSAGSLIDADHAALAGRYGRGFPEAADWMLMGALRDSENRVTKFRGLPDDAVSGMTFPGEIVRWLRATGAYDDVADRATRLVPAGIDAALALRPSVTTDVLVLINLHLLRELQSPTGRRRAAGYILRGFPDHWAVLVAPVDERPDGRIALRVWSWGTVLEGEVPRETLRANFYGAVVGIGRAVARTGIG